VPQNWGPDHHFVPVESWGLSPSTLIANKKQEEEEKEEEEEQQQQQQQQHQQ